MCNGNSTENLTACVGKKRLFSATKHFFFVIATTNYIKQYMYIGKIFYFCVARTFFFFFDADADLFREVFILNRPASGRRVIDIRLRKEKKRVSRNTSENSVPN